MEWLNYHHLLCFWLVARRGGLVAAAKELHVSASTVWAQLKAVEERLGARLLVRQGRRLQLTPTGERVARLADDLFSLGQEVLSVARGKAEVLPSVRVGVLSSLPRLVTRRFVARALTGHRVVVAHGTAAGLLGELVAHRVDVVLTDEPPSGDGPVRAYAHPVGSSKLALFCRADVKRSLLPQFPKSLSGAPLLLPHEGTPQRQALSAAFARLKVQPKVVAEVDDSALLKALASEGHGVVAAPLVVADELAQLYGLELLGQLNVREAYFALTLHQRLDHPAVEAMLGEAL
ncbi:MAG: LysR family transcriptional regulator [Myxococcaceae bacterium]|nr:LysR family transcriptional regulator [Myxococcaceae bacterium]